MSLLLLAVWTSATAPAGAHSRPSLPSARALAGTVREMTGLSPSQVTVENVCGAARPGYATCAAQTLVRRSTRARVRPRIGSRATFTQIFPRGRGAVSRAVVTAAGAGSAWAAAAPQAGTPAYLQQAYDLTYLSQTAGASDTVAVVDAYNDPTAESDLAAYRSTYGLPACTTANGCFTKVNQNGASSPLPRASSSWEQEMSLDLDAVSALCPSCRIVLVETNSAYVGDLDAGIAAAQGLGADQISNSWGTDSTSPVGVSSFPGVSVIAAAGDHGYPGAGVDSYPAAFPGVTAAGGTTLTPDGAGARGFSESAWSLNGSEPGLAGASGCDLHEAKPSYQTDTGCTGRAWTDVSADANPATGLIVYDSGNGGWLLMGGTSLATPLIAAYEAVTGIGAAGPQWPYRNSATLSDPVTGSTGTCAPAILYVCNAGPGYDGPTGAGSISGAVVAGAPGISGPAVGNSSGNTNAPAVGPTTATVTGGVYPNRLDTSYFWQYGLTAAYGQVTGATDIGPGATPVTAPATLTGLTPNTTYDYRLVAQNSDGTAYGYNNTLTTAPGAAAGPAPVATGAPVISGAAQQGQTLTASTGTWTPSPSAYTYQWQRSTAAGPSWVIISGATSASHTLTGADVGTDVRVLVTAIGAYGWAGATAAPVGPVRAPAPVSPSRPVNRKAVQATAHRGVDSSAQFSAVRISARWVRVSARGKPGRAVLLVRVAGQIHRSRHASLRLTARGVRTVWVALRRAGQRQSRWLRIPVRAP
jgi:hypothetical protein